MSDESLDQALRAFEISSKFPEFTPEEGSILLTALTTLEDVGERPDSTNALPKINNVLRVVMERGGVATWEELESAKPTTFASFDLLLDEVIGKVNAASKQGPINEKLVYKRDPNTKTIISV